MNNISQSRGNSVKRQSNSVSEHQRLYDQFGAMAYGIILQIIPQPKQAQEVLLDVFTSPQLDAYRADSSSPALHIIRLARSKALEVRARAVSGPHFAEPVSTASDYSPAYVFDLSFRQGYTPDAIAEQLGISKPDVLKAIREYIHPFRQS